jgi:chemotaxis signal transduction protein
MSETPRAKLSDAGEMLSCYIVELAGDLYALPPSEEIALSWVQRPQEPTYLPTLPPWCLGLVNERNTPVLLVDLGALLGLPAREAHELGDHARHVFVARADETIGFLVERTHRFRVLPVPALASDGALVAGALRSGDETIRLLNLEAIWRAILSALGTPREGEAAA